MMHARTYFIACGLLLLAFALRVWGLDALALRGDEAFNAVHWTKTPFSPEWLTLIESEPNPGSLIIYWAWTRFTGTSEFALRYLPLLMNLLGGAVTAALGWRLLRRRPVGLWLLAVWSVAPFLIWHAQDARQYAILTLLTPLTFYLLLRALDDDTAPAAKKRLWAGYVIVQTLTLYVYSIEVFWMMAQGVYVLSLRRRDALRSLVYAWGVVGLLIVPLAVQVYVVTFVSEYQATAVSAELSALFTEFVPTLLFGESRVPFLVGVALFGLLLWLASLNARARWLVGAWLVIPLILLTVVSIRANFFLPRYVTAVTPAFLLALVIGAESLRGRFPRFPARSLYAAYLIVALLGFYHYVAVAPPKSPDWRGLTAYLAERTTPHSVVILGTPDSAIEYYRRGDGQLFLLPYDWYETDDWRTRLDAILQENDSIFLLTGYNTGEIGAHLQESAQHIAGDTWPNVVQYRRWEVAPREIAHTVDLQLGDVAILRGYTQLGSEQILLYWEALRQTERDHSVLFHLEDASGVVTALDHGIANAIISTRAWTAGSFYRDPVALPRELPAGVYTLHVGLYPVDDPDARLNAPDRDGDGRYAIAEITITSSSTAP